MTRERNKNIQKWLETHIENQKGKIVIITGANSGVGFEAARILTHKGAFVILACRNPVKGQIALDKILSESAGASVKLMQLDLASQSSIREFVREFKAEFDKLDILVNNAGVMATPHCFTEDGYEMQFGTNHLGHFSLTGLLIDMLSGTVGSRVVTLTSIAHYPGKIDFDDLNYEKSYSRMGSYRRSKLANILFAYELQRHFTDSGNSSMSVAAHPGITSTNIVSLPPFIDKLKELVLMSAIKGSLSIVKGATDRNLKGGEYIGPSGFRESVGYPSILESSAQSHDKELAKRLWSVSEDLTGISY